MHFYTIAKTLAITDFQASLLTLFLKSNFSEAVYNAYSYKTCIQSIPIVYNPYDCAQNRKLYTIFRCPPFPFSENLIF